MSVFDWSRPRSERPAAWKSWLAVALAPALASVCASALACTSSTSPPEDGTPEAARVFGEVITEAQVDTFMKEMLYREHTEGGNPAKVYEARRAALEGMIDERVLASLADSQGITPEEVLRNQVAAEGGVDDEDIARFFSESAHRLPPGRSLEEMREAIRRFLEDQKSGEAMMALREKAPIRIVLSAPRAQVAPRGPGKGPEDARVQIVEFSDYECPYCARAEPIIAELLEKYGDQVRFVYRHLPLAFHANARPAAIAAVCAESQGRFWDYHALLFENQRDLGAEALARHAQTLELDLDAFSECLGSEDAASRVAQDMSDGQAAGANGTPAFFVNGILMSGAQPVEAFSQVIDEELARLASE